MHTGTVRRVLMTADAVGGVWHYSLQLSRLLTARGARVLLAVMGPQPSAAQRREAQQVPGLVLHTCDAALEWMPNAWRDVDRAAAWLLALEDVFEPDVVHLNGYAHGALPWRAPALVVAHSCVCSWWDAVHGTVPPPEWAEYIRRVRQGLAGAAALVVPSAAMRDMLVRHYGLGERAHLIPNCRTIRGVRLATKEAFVLAAGRVWDAAKNIASLDDAAAHIEWPVYVAGDAAAPDGGSRALAHTRPLGVVGAAELQAWMARAAIYALPARYEPFGLSVLQAAQASCALVLGDITSLRENWDGVARFVHPDRPDQLRDALRDLIADPGARDRLGQAARARAQAFSPSRHVAAYEDVYRSMVARHDWTAHSARSL